MASPWPAAAVGALCSATSAGYPCRSLLIITWRFCAAGRSSDSKTSIPNRLSASASCANATVIACVFAGTAIVLSPISCEYACATFDIHKAFVPHPREAPCCTSHGTIPPPWE